MLYVTTRDDLTTYTSEQAMRDRRAPDGGFYIPHRIPKLSLEELRMLRKLGRSERIWSTARRFLRIQDTAVIPISLQSFGNRITVCEVSAKERTPFRDYVNELADRMYTDRSTDPVWLGVSMRIGIIAAAIVEVAGPNDIIDISMVSGDMFGPMSAYLAREMGLPVGNILCCCNENSGVWDLLSHGALRTDRNAVRTCIPEADVAVPDGLEAMIALCCSREEVRNYLDAVRSGMIYVPGPEELEQLRAAFHSVVVTRSGLVRGAHIPSSGPVKACSALALAGLLDYRAGNGSCRPALVIPE